jgi:hypothetical protein
MSPTQNFEDFIGKLGRETVAAINKEKRIVIPRQKKESTASTPVTTVQSSLPVSPKVLAEEKKEALSEDFIEKALDYAKIIVKTVRKTFESEDERKKVFEAIRNTVNLFLEEEKPKQYFAPTVIGGSKNTAGGISSPPNFTETMSEEEWNKMPDVQESVEQDIPFNPQVQTTKTGYKRDLPIALREGRDGKKEVDLSKISEQDINDIKVLAGIQ